jgi:hypothetical protein
MGHDRFCHECRLGVLRWLGMPTDWRRHRGQATKPRPAPQNTRPPQIPKPFAGVSKKPHGAACEQGQAYGAQLPFLLPPLIVPQRGRPCAVDAATEYLFSGLS